MTIDEENARTGFSNRIGNVVRTLGEHPLISVSMFIAGMGGIAIGAETDEAVLSIAEMTTGGTLVFLGAMGIAGAMARES